MAQWNGDGTQDPGPPPLHTDPLAGLVTGRRHEQDAMRVRVVEPVMPDISAVREAMQAVLDDDSELLMTEPVVEPVADSVTLPTPRPEAETGPPTSELPRVSDPPASVDSGGPPDTAAARKPAPPARVRKSADSTRPGMIPAQRTVAPPSSGPPRRGFSPGIAAIVALLAVIAVLAVVAIASLIDTIASLFS